MQKGIDLVVSDDAKKHLIEEGYDEAMGVDHSAVLSNKKSVIKSLTSTLITLMLNTLKLIWLTEKHHQRKISVISLLFLGNLYSSTQTNELSFYFNSSNFDSPMNPQSIDDLKKSFLFRIIKTRLIFSQISLVPDLIKCCNMTVDSIRKKGHGVNDLEYMLKIVVLKLFLLGF